MKKNIFFTESRDIHTVHVVNNQLEKLKSGILMFPYVPKTTRSQYTMSSIGNSKFVIQRQVSPADAEWLDTAAKPEASLSAEAEAKAVEAKAVEAKAKAEEAEAEAEAEAWAKYLAVVDAQLEQLPALDPEDEPEDEDDDFMSIDSIEALKCDCVIRTASCPHYW